MIKEEIAIEFIKDLFSTFTPREIIGFIIVLFIIYMVTRKSLSHEEYSELNNNKDERRDLIKSFVEGETTLVLYTSCRRAEEILENISIDDCNSACGDKPKASIMNKYSSTMRIAVTRLNSLTMERIFTDRDEYIGVTPEELEDYIQKTGRDLVIKIREGVRDSKGAPKEIVTSKTERFTIDEGIEMFRKIIKKAIKLHEKEMKKNKEVRAKYSLVSKINPLPALFNVIGKNSK